MAKAKSEKSPVDPESISLPTRLIESLLVAVSMSDKAAVSNISATIREHAEKQAPVTFHA